MASDKKYRDEEGFLRLKPKPRGPYAQWLEERRNSLFKIPKDSDVFLYNMVDIYGSDNIMNGSVIEIGDYSFNKGIIHAANMNVGRSIPWCEDGLKSVERRVLYVMHKRGYYGRKTAKVASVVGAMIEMVYPHGDAAPASTIFRLGRHRSMMLPYVQELSNYGNMQDLEPAAARYADCALTNYAMDCFFSEIGPRKPLYDEKDSYNFHDKEPIYLTSRYPNILMQWNLGIGKGAMSWLGAFNSTDLFKATLTLMDNPEAKIDIYPDAPVPIEIINKGELKGCFDQDSFKVKMRAPYYVETDQRRNGARIENKYTIVFTALPLGVTGDQVAKEIADIKLEDAKKGAKRLPEILNVEVVADDVSDGGIRIIVEYEHGYDPNALAEKLFKSTSLAKTIGVKYNLIFENKPDVRSPREILLMWINQRYDQKRRYYTQMVLKAARDKAMYEALGILAGSKENQDKAINIIRSSNGPDESIPKLRKAFDLTEFQARCILNYRLSGLQKLDIKDTLEKRKAAIEDYKYYRKLLVSEGAIKEAVREELLDGLKKYGRQRMAKLKNLKSVDAADPNRYKYLFYNENMYFCTDDLSEFMLTNGAKLDYSYKLLRLRNSDPVIVFDKSGAMRSLTGYAFSNSDHGISMASLGVLGTVGIMLADPGKDYDSVVLVTTKGYGKIMDLAEVTRVNKGRAITLADEDTLAAVVPVKSDYHPDSMIGMVSGDRMFYLRIVDFPRYKRASAGNRMVKATKEPVAITRAFAIDATDDADYLLIYGESGYVKVVDTQYLAFSKRGNNILSMGGKNVYGAVVAHVAETKLELLAQSKDKIVSRKAVVTVGKTLEFKLDNSGVQKLRLGTTVAAPVKLLKLGKNDWYQLQ